METYLENNKFYVPSIEEFHVGFEYEYYGDPIPNPDRWYKAIFKDEYGMINNRLIEYSKPLIRTKYLDQEDIESLGFKEDSWTERTNWVWLSNDRRFILFYIPKIYKLTITDTNRGFKETSGKYYHHQMFEGIVKNKSVLKQVFKMIGV